MYLILSIFVSVIPLPGSLCDTYGYCGSKPQTEKSVAEIEQEIASLEQRLRDLRRALQVRSKITVIGVSTMDPKEAVRIIKVIYQDAPEVVIAEPLVQLKAIAIRAGEKTTQEVKELFDRINRTSTQFGGPQISPELIMDEVKRLLEKRKTPR